MTAFWVLAPIMVLAALGILFVRKAVHAALLLAVVMISLAVLYAVAGGAVSLRGADHRLHRRDPHAVPVRADARGRRRLRLGRRDHPGSARARVVRGHRGRRGGGGRARPGHLRQHGRPRRGQPRRQRAGAGETALLALRLRLRDHERPCSSPPRSARWVLTHRERLTPRKTQRDLAADRLQAYAAPARTSVRFRPRASTPATTPSTPRPCCPTAPPLRPRCFARARRPRQHAAADPARHRRDHRAAGRRRGRRAVHRRPRQRAEPGEAVEPRGQGEGEAPASADHAPSTTTHGPEGGEVR